MRPKEKVGENPPDNDDAPIRSWDYTERIGEGQANRVPLLTAQRFNSIAVGNAHGWPKEEI